ncbi:hypothetical protein G4B88_000941 [Cannabis sativa]|uniref:Uncharacterized protein n=1 Tax=Cannabis sativa TaxID=3483 RepID=A0A7J6E1T3_CANSA|nr:hypothetical protein G4B88_000941 [Cannabis sativa]
MYIDSPMQEDEGDCSTSYNNNNEGEKKKFLTKYRHTDAEDEDGVRSDDSMASDASSGHTHHYNNNVKSHHSKEASRLKQDKKTFSITNKKDSILEELMEMEIWKYIVKTFQFSL